MPVVKVEALYPTTSTVLNAILARDFDCFHEQTKLLLSHDGLSWLCHLDSKEGHLWLEQTTNTSFDHFLMQVEFDLGTANMLALFNHADWRPLLLSAETKLIAQIEAQLQQGLHEGWIAKNVNCSGTALLLYSLFVGLLTVRDMGIPVDRNALADAVARLCRSLMPE